MAASQEVRRDNMVAGPVVAQVLAVIDGDTLVIAARIWIGQTIETRVRLVGVDTPELRGACDGERDRAAAARDFVAAAVAGGDVVLWNIRYDKYGGRVLARVETPAGADLGRLLIDAGLGRAYDGGARTPWC
jgi:endonuclease YncB( thermonuclease family)